MKGHAKSGNAPVLDALESLRSIGDPSPAQVQHVEQLIMSKSDGSRRHALGDGPFRFTVAGAVMIAFAGVAAATIGVASYYYWTVEEIPIDESTSQFKLTNELTGETEITEPLPNDTLFLEIEGEGDGDNLLLGVTPVDDPTGAVLDQESQDDNDK
jgi:hypothetical protein